MTKTTKKETTKKRWKDTWQAKYDKKYMQPLCVAYKRDYNEKFRKACRKLYPNTPISQVVKGFMEYTINGNKL